MHGRPLLAFALVLSLVLAGCGDVADVGTTRDPFTVEPTTEPVTREVATVDFSPNPETNRYGDAVVFLNSQGERLSNTSYHVDYEYELRTANGRIIRHIVTSGTYARNESRFVARQTVTGELSYSNRTILYYGNGTHLFRGMTPPNQTATENVSVDVVRSGDGTSVTPAEIPVFRGQRSDFLYTAFSAMNVTSVEELDRPVAGFDEQLFRFQGDSVDDADLLTEAFVQPSNQGNATVETASLDAIVSRTGFVLEFTLRAVIQTDEGETVVVTQRLGYHDVGTATVSTPDWIGANASASLTAS
ncbi:hypothetical protein [Haloarchaeobius sp. HRN-SO-5]|uniref:hypothetical protein n=1 Tax=Haloarchaeobius sp. HRN-SO-5 TaxID=3446118 RepID=UPI003EB8F02B